MVEVTESIFSKISAGDLKKGNILVLRENGYTYVKVGDISKCKTGKHGSAKALISGTNIKTTKGYEGTFSVSAGVEIAKPVKTMWIVMDIDEDDDCIYVEPNVKGGSAEMDTLQGNQINRDDVEKIYREYREMGSGDQLLIYTLMCPELILIDDIRVVKDGK
ncbi:Translation initiation factor eIF-5A [Spraguea lophii 42_110]|uniref:Translation initiation factor eIF-5A n=1 Tax=Spraguea lophii (strain 42_110) TaxID=1358809 RepID=S7XTW4_SPRLO|nr:Translation initiation factor eIF-5A [Spraguea lophii 42_110]